MSDEQVFVCLGRYERAAISHLWWAIIDGFLWRRVAPDEWVRIG